jgi:hypothetical protein
MTTKPDSIDYQRVEQKHGPLPASATDAEHAHRYRLAQAAALIRLSARDPLTVIPTRRTPAPSARTVLKEAEIKSRPARHDGERNT